MRRGRICSVTSNFGVRASSAACAWAAACAAGLGPRWAITWVELVAKRARPSMASMRFMRHPPDGSYCVPVIRRRQDCTKMLLFLSAESLLLQALAFQRQHHPVDRCAETVAHP